MTGGADEDDRGDSSSNVKTGLFQAYCVRKVEWEKHLTDAFVSPPYSARPRPRSIGGGPHRGDLPDVHMYDYQVLNANIDSTGRVHGRSRSRYNVMINRTFLLLGPL